MPLTIPQPGVLGLGTPHHVLLELTVTETARSAAVAAAVSALTGAETIGQGINLVVGFAPELWCAISAADCPAGLTGFDEPLVGDDGFTMPATQHDVVVWIAAPGRDVAFDAARAVLRELSPLATLADETTCWSYHRHLDLTGFVDGTENPELGEASEVAVVQSGPGAGGSVLLLQRWRHEPTWDALDVEAQEAAIGRTKDTDEELDPRPESSHVARTDQEDAGHILRRNMAYGTVSHHGTMFIGLCATREVLHGMLERMAGRDGEPRDALTRHTTPETGSYYFLPSLGDLARLMVAG